MTATIFAQPGMWWVASAVAAPIIIHLILRTRPRRMIFPALRFVRTSHEANLSTHWLKHLLLLAMRMGMVVLLAWLMARWMIPSWTAARQSRPVVAAVLVIDNSGSMGYRHAGQTLLAKAKQLAGELIGSFGEGSTVAVVTTAAAGEPSEFQISSDLLTMQIADVPQTPSHDSLAPAIARAVGMLSTADRGRREVYVLTDQTAQAWRDGAGAAGAAEITFAVLDCGPSDRSNMSLSPPAMDSTALAAGTSLTLRAVLHGDNAGGETAVVAELDGRPVGERTLDVPVGGTASLEMPITLSRQGVLGGQLALRRSDGLEMDNVRYFTLNVVPPPDMLLVCDRPGDETYFVARSAVTPGGYVRPTTISADRLERQALAGVSVVMLANVAVVSNAQWALLDEFVRSGGRLWVVAGDSLNPQAYGTAAAQALLPAVIGSFQELAEPVQWSSPAGPHEMLEPFRAEKSPPLSEVRCQGRYAIASTADDTEVVLAFADGPGAVFRRRVGQGQVVLWNFCLDRKHFWPEGLSQLGLLAQRTVRLLAGQQRGPSMALWGQEVVLPLPPTMPHATAAVLKPASLADESLPVDAARRKAGLKADRLGNWLVRFMQEGRQIEHGFSVNADPAESDLTAADVEKIRQDFPAGSVTFCREVKDALGRQQSRGELDLAPPILLALLVLLTAESFFSNRFYRHAGNNSEP